MSKRERNIRIIGKRAPFDPDKFVRAILAHAEALSKAEEKQESLKIKTPAELSLERKALRPIRDGQPWTEDDLTRLRVLRELGRPNTEIARRIGRTEGAMLTKISEIDKQRSESDCAA